MAKVTFRPLESEFSSSATLMTGFKCTHALVRLSHILNIPFEKYIFLNDTKCGEKLSIINHTSECMQRKTATCRLPMTDASRQIKNIQSYHKRERFFLRSPKEKDILGFKKLSKPCSNKLGEPF